MENEITVNVAVRVRPLLPKEETNVIQYVDGEPPVLVVSDKRNIFAFDHIFNSDVQQEEVYNTMLKPLVSRVLSGYNCTILAYGQTGTGKTYTMGSDLEKYYGENAGLISRVFDEFFDSDLNPEITVSISFIEIYNEKVYDLLRPNKSSLIVKGVRVQDMSCITVDNSSLAVKWIKVGGRGRHVGNTCLNSASSRSHAVFTLYCSHGQTGITSKLHLVDLAGSESVRRTGNQGKAFQEGVTINKGLLSIGRVINALSKHSKVIPYRDSTLTTILQDSLNVNNFVSLLACVSPSSEDISETLATLRFAEKAKELKSRPQLETIVAEYDKTHPGLLQSCVKALPTPLKRISKPAFITSTQIKKIPPKNTRDVFSPSTTLELDHSSVSTSTMLDIPQPSYSPLVKRCTEVLKNTMLEHLNTIVKNHLNGTQFSENKENSSPNLPWDIESKVTQIVRNELIQLTEQKSKERSRNTDTSIKRHLSFEDSPEILEKSRSPILLSEPEFKVPIGRPVKKQKNALVDAAISPITIQTRRSMRLSLKNIETPTPAPRKRASKNYKFLIEPPINNRINDLKDEFVFKTPIVSSPKNIRRSKRFTLMIDSPVFRPTRRSLRLSMKNFASLAPTPAPRRQILELTTSQPIPAPRIAIMHEQKSLDTHVANLKTPKGQMAILKMKKSKHLAGPHKRHKENVLNIINKGTAKDLQLLPTVGVKTALQIITYRELNGKFRNFDDLKEMPSWRGKGFDRFMQSNNLL